MSGEGEAAGDVLTGAVIAHAVEGHAGAASPDAVSQGPCKNCGAQLSGAFCAACGQPTRIHRSLLSLGHDILHGVFHFEGKMWRTIPELFFHPGRLTRRYIDGERMKFVSPMALYLFTVFLMFGVISAMTGSFLSHTDNVIVTDNFKKGNRQALAATEKKIEELENKLEDENLAPENRDALKEELAGLESSRTVMEAMADGNWAKLADVAKERTKLAEEKAARERKQKQGQEAQPAPDAKKGKMTILSDKVDTGWPWLDRRLAAGIAEANSNPGLLLYKLKVNGYKFSWALIPLSVPFMWLLFFWRRDVHVYDHAIFVTYSLSFMMLLVILCSIASAIGVSAALWGWALGIIPPLHLYKQLRGAYGLSRFGAGIRLFLLSIATIFVLVLFGLLLLLLGVIG